MMLKDIRHDEEKDQLIETDWEMIPMIGLVDKHINMINVTIFYIPYEQARRKIEHVKQTYKTLKRIEIKLLVLKTTVSETKLYTWWD